jgi:hypothetical protein
MAYTLSDLLQASYRKLGQLNTSTATGGSTSSIVDTKLINTSADDSWKDGVAFLSTTTDGLAPQGEYKRISAFAASTGTLTLESTVTATVGSGDVFGYCNSFYPLQTMIQIANDALAYYGDILLTDTTSITTAASQTEYTVPVTLKRSTAIRVDMQGITSDANDNRWEKLEGWEWIPAAAGSTGLLVLPFQPVIGYKLRVWYRGQHGALTVYNSTIHEEIDRELLAMMLTEKALEWQNSRLSGNDDYLLQRWNDAKMQVSERERKNPPRRMPRHNKVFFMPAGQDDTDNFTVPTP